MTLKVGFAEVGVPRTTVRAAQGAEGSFKTSETSEHLHTFETTVRAAQGAEGSFKPFETSVGDYRDSREHLVTFGTTVGDCLLLKMLKKTCDSKYRLVEF
jgi:hypothetical protein